MDGAKDRTQRVVRNRKKRKKGAASSYAESTPGDDNNETLVRLSLICTSFFGSVIIVCWWLCGKTQRRKSIDLCFFFFLSVLSVKPNCLTQRVGGVLDPFYLTLTSMCVCFFLQWFVHRYSNSNSQHRTNKKHC